MTIIYDLENWVKATTRPLLKISVYVKNEPNGAKWKVYMLLKRIFERSI